MDRGLYRAEFAATSGQKNRYDVDYELPRPVRGERPRPHRAKGPRTRLQWKVLSLGYFDRSSHGWARQG